MRLPALLLLPVPLLLVACEARDGDTSVSFNIQGEDGNVTVATDESGRARIRAPGVEGSIKLPRLKLDADDIDADGLKLYPGSTIANFDLQARGRGDAKNEGRVTIAFEAPASLDKVQAWFRDQGAKQGFTLAPAGNGFAGTTDEGDPVRIELEANGADKAKGRLILANAR